MLCFKFVSVIDIQTPVQARGAWSILGWMRFCLLIFAGCLSLSVFAADENSPVPSPGEGLPDQKEQGSTPVGGEVSTKPEETMEEITVIGHRQIFQLRKLMFEAENRYFEIFNELNDDDMYDITCEMVAPVGSHIKKRRCVPRFYQKAQQAEAERMLGNWGGADADPATVFARQYPIMVEKVRVLALQHPELLGAIKEKFELTEEYKSKKKAFHGTEDE